MTLEAQLAALPDPLLQRLRSRGFDPERLAQWAAMVGKDRDARNRLSGTVEPPAASDIADLPAEGTPEHARCREAGLAALRRGEVALCVLAGGMATRMGGVVKALVEALPGQTFLDLRLGEHEHLAQMAGAPVPLWLMTSEATEGPIREALGERLRAEERVATFEQHVALRLTPEGALFLDDQGEPSVYATGHGDLPDALRKSGLLQRFLARGGRTVWIANLDNLGASVDPVILGWHLGHGGALSVEVVDKVGSDKGGGPVRWNGRPVVVEEFRLPVGFDGRSVPVFSTNTFLVDAAALEGLSLAWTYIEVDKQVGDRRAVQFERILNELTVALPTRVLRVPREGAASRFLPVKDVAELERRRPELEVIARARGMLA
ncbi:UTP--glucose-1-phosphate uridylyltransferase [Chondromyces apiculatus]|uniref:N-acetylglucosamine-1-phosphate uridyltransferase eukaryotic n=1 Tax=Chondromyces apiculatus DSM 436 TaxID=1192034 RepID=A0A017TDA0_9BACT|nr:UTP--glucose-1-phosphate uridylyltransferase [Chondromyces apiculatus]EYF06541.1 N-acetylglucosamine-1-phosphate uridyltransferase eukaryotic [Chondromyces apiculatus DSM 436]